ncbi:hypothetical protein DICVIV_11373 [Dictyocaulus viviparus]|uniref:Endonuclease/exonuclease/phosphatase domain-containing protein n=1 Tax=Dictyocaulus viviparus TaxID=29172 RepID=A0A0D8XFV3_DICVI|nr:hypothetical protein DICVIV_11373 [Dictyocaulus viviparus]
MTFVNLNLHSVPFEDVNEIAQQPEVTKTAQKRLQQIETLLRELENEGLREDAIIVAGAFNAQLHETQLLTHLAKTQMVKTVAKRDATGQIAAIEHFDKHGRVIHYSPHKGTVESHQDCSIIMTHLYNSELAPVTFKGQLKEQSVFFQPSRHYEISESGKEEFMRILCPAWADRILYNGKMDLLFRHDSFCASGLYYGLVGKEVHIGQYKPVALHATICLK